MRKLTLAFAVLASLGGAGYVASASAAPGAPVGVTAPDTVVNAQMSRMERRMMRRDRRMMRRERRMDRRMMRRRMMRRQMMRGM